MVPEDDLATASHLVVGCKLGRTAPKRTLKVLHAVLRGAWVLNTEWLLSSIDAGQLMSEAPYELHAVFPGARMARETVAARGFVAPLDGVSLFLQERDAEAKEKLRHLARAAGSLRSGQTPCLSLQHFVTHAVPRIYGCIRTCAAGASVVSTLRGATICVGGPGGSGRTGVTFVRPEWLYDCCAGCTHLPTEPYATA